MMWICPECAKRRWSCEDLGPGQHLGWAANVGQTERPRCARHPDVPMVLGDPAIPWNPEMKTNH